MEDLSLSEARGDLAQLVERVHHRLERFFITKYGRRVAALVPVEDLELLERLEDHLDLDAAREAKTEGGPRIDYAKLRKELGL